ncbi:DUF397 domain-containing protein [Actinomadura adrarensis]|uniref:DUF397 domain-containing protein n=1 Tax=Actinomadura adrarensis TaxID=1819600 RepID=A0ABW3CBW9_9ACTN
MSVNWRKSSHSGTQGDCVEVAVLSERAGIGLRDSKNTELGHLTVPAEALKGLLRRIKAGDLDV